MDALTQLLLRNLDQLRDSGRLLWINPSAACDWRELAAAGVAPDLFCQDFGDWRRLAQSGAPASFGSFPAATDPLPDGIILSLPREKDRLRMLAHAAASLLPASGRLFLLGENRAGIKSGPRQLEPYFTAVTKLDSARHSGLFAATGPRAETPFQASDYELVWQLQAGSAQLDMHSWPGVFAHGGLDAGTRLLLDHLPGAPRDGRVLDFACGAGVIGATLLARNPKLECVLADSSSLACLACETTLKANGLDGRVIASDGLSEVEGRFDMIVTNPPFHVRHQSVVNLSPALLAPVRNFLQPGGQLLLVANRHLPYRRWLDETFGNHAVIAGDQRFHILKATHKPA